MRENILLNTNAATQKQIIENIIKNKDVKFLIKWLFKTDITESQEKIIRTILYSEHKRITVCAPTRYGKTTAVMAAVAAYLIFNKGKRIALIGAHEKHARNLRDVLVELAFKWPILLDLMEANERSSINRLKKEANRVKQTYKNGCMTQTFSAKSGHGLMGFGVNGLIIVDEATGITRENFAKITRMLGDDINNCIMVLMFNPFSVDTAAYDCWESDEYLSFNITPEIAIKEGRLTEEYLDEKKRELGEDSLLYKVLYKSEFPDLATDALFSIADIKNAQNRVIDIIEDEQTLFIIALDPAGYGKDEAVIFWGLQHGNQYKIEQKNVYSERVSDQMKLSSKVIEIWRTHNKKNFKTIIKVDTGFGEGIISRLEQLRNENKWHYDIMRCMFGGKAIESDFYENAKAENFFRLANIFKTGRIQIPDNKKIFSQLMAVRWKQSSNSERFKIKENEQPDDFGSGLCIFTWVSGDSKPLILSKFRI